jgi:hypothetical protein
MSAQVEVFERLEVADAVEGVLADDIAFELENREGCELLERLSETRLRRRVEVRCFDAAGVTDLESEVGDGRGRQ